VAVLASPLVLGFSSGLLKRAADKLIPSFCPTSTLRRRGAGTFPATQTAATGGVVSDEPDTVDEDRAITREIWSRMARNANTSLIACLSTTMATTEVAMRLLALNGSPRGPKSNSRFLTDEFCALRGHAGESS